MKKLNSILIVEDDIVAVFLHESHIKATNSTESVKIVSDGAEALDYLKKGSVPDLILLDLRMPVLDWFEFLEAFNSLELKNKNKAKIVVSSSSIREDDQNRAKELGAVDYLVKPNTKNKMNELLEKHF